MNLLNNILLNLDPGATLDPNKRPFGCSKHISGQLQIADKITKILAKKLNVSDTVMGQLDTNARPFDIIFSATPLCGIVNIPPIYLIEREKIPFTGPNDPSLNDSKKVQEFADWVARKSRQNSKKVTVTDRMNLRIFLKCMEKPEEAQKAFKFALGHELGHIYYRHRGNPGLFGGHSRKCEKEADAFSYKHSKEFAEGGLYLFQTFKNPGLKSLKERIVHLLARMALTFSHTSCGARIRAIKRHLASTNPS